MARPKSVKVLCGLAACSLAVTGCIRGGWVFAPEDDVDETRFGSIAVVVETTGAVPDADGYVVELDEVMSTPIPVTGEASFSFVAQGYYNVNLNDVDPPCYVSSTNPVALYVFPDATAVADFDVVCP